LPFQQIRTSAARGFALSENGVTLVPDGRNVFDRALSCAKRRSTFLRIFGIYENFFSVRAKDLCLSEGPQTVEKRARKRSMPERVKGTRCARKNGNSRDRPSGRPGEKERIMPGYKDLWKLLKTAQHPSDVTGALNLPPSKIDRLLRSKRLRKLIATDMNILLTGLEVGSFGQNLLGTGNDGQDARPSGRKHGNTAEAKRRK
jgi:hypothetical protein